MNITDLDIIYISYDEPNAEKNFTDLIKKIPWAKRVHGVKGSDNAHKAAANLSETPRFITIDGDNIVNSEFFNQRIHLTKEDEADSVISWSCRNIVNGLVYGNGGIKSWPKEFVLNMKTHENASEDDTANKIEFCWGTKYIQMNNIYSVSHINGSPLQAFRAGFREGVKMGLDRGNKVNKVDFKHSIFVKNYHRLCIWQSVGADVQNGLWAIYGARLGCYMTNCTDWNFINVRDFEWINEFFKNEVSQKINEQNILEETVKIGKKLLLELNIDICDFNSQQSKFFKEVYVNPLRVSEK
jgi:hypothetical protein